MNDLPRSPSTVATSDQWKYAKPSDRIELLYKDGSIRDIAEASDNLGIAALSSPVEKWYLAWPRGVVDGAVVNG